MSNTDKNDFTEKVLSLDEFESWMNDQSVPFTLLGDGLTLIEPVSVRNDFKLINADVVKPEAFVRILENRVFHDTITLADAKLNYLLDPEIG
jgi:hypothetical protein